MKYYEQIIEDLNIRAQKDYKLGLKIGIKTPEGSIIADTTILPHKVRKANSLKKCDVIFVGNSRLIYQILQGKVNPIAMFMAKKVKVKGKLKDAIKVAKVL